MNKKAVFLDIDGTMIDFTGKMPESAEYAIRQAKKNGHHMVICSGRSLYQLYPKLLEMGFSGVVAAAGACVMHDGKEIFHKYMEKDKRKWLIEYLERNNFLFSIQTSEGTLGSKKCLEAIKEMVFKSGMSEKMYKTVNGQIKIRKDLWEDDHIEKILFYGSPFPLDQVRMEISPFFDLTASSLNDQRLGGEISIAGINKATGMDIYLKHAKIHREDTIAVGDGPNDFEMLEYAQTGIAMGNAIKELKETADFVTTDINQDGLYNAFTRFGLI